MARPREHNEATRLALRQGIGRLFDEQGGPGLSARNVANVIGASTRSVYALFGSMDGLLVDTLAERAYRMLEQRLDEQRETTDPGRDLIEAGVTIFRPFVRDYPLLFRLTFQRPVPDFRPGPELLAARDSSYGRLTAKVERLGPAGMLKNKAVAQAVLEFQALCEGLGNFELRGPALPLLPNGAEETAWRSAFTTLVTGFGWREGASRPERQAALAKKAVRHRLRKSG